MPATETQCRIESNSNNATTSLSSVKQISEKANSEPFEGFPANADKSILNNRLNGIKIDNGLVKHVECSQQLKRSVPASHSGFCRGQEPWN